MKVLDIVVNLWTSDLTRHYTPKLNHFWQQINLLDATGAGIPLTEEIRRMDEAKDAHSPAYWDPSFVRFINSRRGRDKVLFGTDWPVVDFARAIRETNDLGLKEESRRRLLWDNAVRVYRLEDWE